MSPQGSSPLSTAELKEFRSLASEASSRPGYSIARVAEELGFADSSPLRKILRNPKRTTSRERLEQLRKLLGRDGSGPVSGAAVSPSKPASTSKPTSKSASTNATSARGAGSAGPEEWISSRQAQEFKDRVKQLRQGGWTVDSLAIPIGYHHGRSLWKALASGHIRRRTFDALMALPTSPGGTAVTASRGAETKAKSTGGPSRPSTSPKAAATVVANGAGKQGTGPLRGATGHLAAARRHLELARTEVQQASTASQLLAPGLREIMNSIEDIGRQLDL